MNEQVGGKIRQGSASEGGVTEKVLSFVRATSAAARRVVPGGAWIIGGLLSLLLFAGLVGTLLWASGGHAGVQYATAPVTRGPITRSVTATGTVNPVLTIIVGSYVSGVIQQLYCDYNTQVKQGQICAKIDPRPYQSVVNENKANLAVQKAQLEKDKADLVYLKLTYERNAHLLKTYAASQDAVDNAKSAYDQAQAQIALDEATIDQRQAELDAAQVNLDYTNISSPVDGTVVSRNVTMGQTVAASFQTSDTVPDRHRSHQDAGRHQRQRKRHRRHQGGRPRDLRGRRVSKAYVRRCCDPGASVASDGAERRNV